MVFYLVCTFIFLEVMQGPPMGIMRGLGIQKHGSLVVLFGFWIFGLPCASILLFEYGMGPIGFWTGQVLANSFDFIALTIIALNANWNKNITKMSIRMERSHFALESRARRYSFDKFTRQENEISEQQDAFRSSHF